MRRQGHTNLLVDGIDETGTHIYAKEEAQVEVLLQAEGLDQRCQEEQNGVHIALPGKGVLIRHKGDQQPGG